MPTVVNMHDAKSSLSKLVKRAAALLIRIPSRKRSSPIGVFKGKIHMSDDFDAPLEEFKQYL
ncbi:MAG: DUF2281 domain-containing protein [Acidobacteria bacterium]|nr:DUF2281 domain-containing protein [Acidobacteriota bacterium]